MATKIIVLDGNKFDDMDSFYDEVQVMFCPDFSGFGRNLSALTDVCIGGFGVFEPNEPVKVVWLNSEKSRKDFSYPAPEGYEERLKEFRAAWKLPEPEPLGRPMTQFEVLVECINDETACPNLTLELK